MKIKNVKLENYTVFENLSIPISNGINVFIGENATGKTHLMKLLYSGCCSGRKDVDFAGKIVKTMLPDDYNISRLITRKPGNHKAAVRITASNDDTSTNNVLSLTFDNKTKRWDAAVSGKGKWEKSFNSVSSIYIPAKEILSHSYQLSAATSVGNVKFDDTYVDIINSAKVDISMGKNPSSRSAMLKRIEKMTGGQVVYDAAKDEFYLKQGNSKQEFNLVAEGIKKMGLLWLLAKNGTLEKGSVLFWDEPEANINPAFMSIIADIIMELQKNGVQIFVATHNYFLAKYLDIKKTKDDKISFYSFYKNDNGVGCEMADGFTLLENNAITKTYLKIYRDELGVSL